MNTDSIDNSVLEMFGLTLEQSRLMFSVQKMIAMHDCKISKNNRKRKSKWILEWEKNISSYIDQLDDDVNKDDLELLDETELKIRFEKELGNSVNKTWYYILILECIEFVPYTALGVEDDKSYSKLKYDKKQCYEYVKEFFVSQGYISVEKIDRIDKTYCKSIKRLSKSVNKVFVIFSMAALSAALAAVFAPYIAVAILGASFEGLSGAALVSACLALAGGGAIAAGGLGMTGGVAIIAGGGALLGLAVGGTAVGTMSLIESSPEFALTQAAKLETILKEVVLNAQQDVVNAQKIIAKFKEQIIELKKRCVDLERENDKNKEQIKNIKEIIKYFEKSYKSIRSFSSAYEEGLKNEKENNV